MILSDLDVRLSERIDVDESGCWLWIGALSHDGYGRVGYRGFSSDYAHRAVYEDLVGPIPDGLECDHLCRVRNCVNPSHIEPVTRRENVMRSPICKTAINARKTHCVHGHPLDEENTYSGVRNKRECRACNRAAVRRYSARKRHLEHHPA